MVQWVLENKEWLFSGIGLFFLTLLYNGLRRRDQDDARKYGATYDSGIVDEAMETKENKSVKETVGSRFSRIIELMNQGRYGEIFTLADIAKILAMPSAGALEKVINSGNGVDFNFIHHFAGMFGVNENWLSTGRGTPFGADLYTTGPVGLFDLIQQEAPLGIYFVRDDSEENRVVIVLKLNEKDANGFSFRVMNAPWHVSSHVGATGQRQILDFYLLILRLKSEGFYSICWGKEVSADLFSRLVSGEIFPGEIIEGMQGERYWWDDFTDISGKYVISENYRNWYGQWLSDAQAIVEWKLREQYDNFRVSLANICNRSKQIQQVFLFGSRVSGDATCLSDIDLAVVTQDMDSVQWDNFVNSLENSTILKLDIHRWDEMGEDFRRQVKKSGRIAYER